MGRYTAAWAGKPWSYDQQLWDHMVSIGATMNGTGLAWCDAEPVEGQYNWDEIAYADFCVDEMLARGIEPTFFVGLTPQWAKLHPELEPHRTPPAEEYAPQFISFHQFVADRYRGRVKYYFFWNEPNGCSWINDGCANGDSYPLYTRWLIRCSQAIKGVDPEAKIIAANIDYHAGVLRGYEYIQGMYNEGAGPYFDIISIHPYDWAGTIHWNALTDTRNVMVANGDADKPIWISEFGWNGDYQATADKLVYVLTELKKPEWSFIEQASYLVLNDGANVENYGLMTAKLVPRPGYWAFGNLDKTWPVIVDFTADATIGPAPFSVQFTDISTVQEATSWLWEFGDGTTSTDHDPLHVYTGPEGGYTVRLTVTSAAGSETVEKVGYIRVGDGFPRVAFIGGASPPMDADAQVIDFLQGMGLVTDVYDDERENRPTASQIAASHDLVVVASTVLSANIGGDFRYESVPLVFWESSLAWNEPAPPRESIGNDGYAAAGQTQLNIIDNNHPLLEGISTGPVTLVDSPDYFSYCTGQIASGARVLATAVNNPSYKTLIVVEPGAQLLDGGVAAGKRVMLHLYDATWQQTNAEGRKIVSNALAWTLGKPVAEFSASVTAGPAPLAVAFSDDSTGTATSWDWDFGDGSTSTLRHPYHTYSQPGLYTISLSVGGPGGPVSRVRPNYVLVADGVPGDLDGDTDVDQSDFGLAQACLTGEQVPQLSPECAGADLDGDDDVDITDIVLFESCITGPQVP